VSLEWLCNVVRALQQPTDRAILLCLAGRPMNTQTLAQECELSSEAASGHLNALRRYGIVAFDRESDVFSLADSVAVAFARGLAEARITAPDGDIVSFITHHTYQRLLEDDDDENIFEIS
jgi:hypothetical protein